MILTEFLFLLAPPAFISMSSCNLLHICVLYDDIVHRISGPETMPSIQFSPSSSFSPELLAIVISIVCTVALVIGFAAGYCYSKYFATGDLLLAKLFAN